MPLLTDMKVIDRSKDQAPKPKPPRARVQVRLVPKEHPTGAKEKPTFLAQVKVPGPG
jgi:hypothetical protein